MGSLAGLNDEVIKPVEANSFTGSAIFALGIFHGGLGYG